MTKKPDRAAAYRLEAEEARMMAESMGSSSARNTMLEVAAGWDRLADKEEKTQEKPVLRPD